jgi:hypothetical protein
VRALCQVYNPHSFYVSIPGVRFDMTNPEGRQAFERWVASAIDRRDMELGSIIRQLRNEIDRLRKG